VTPGDRVHGREQSRGAESIAVALEEMLQRTAERNERDAERAELGGSPTWH
jgi:hypothetical protein